MKNKNRKKKKDSFFKILDDYTKSISEDLYHNGYRVEYTKSAVKVFM